MSRCWSATPVVKTMKNVIFVTKKRLCQMENGKWRMENWFGHCCELRLAVLIIDISNAKNSCLSFSSDWYSCCSRNVVLRRSSSQKPVSLHSLMAMVGFATKSALPWAELASLMFAPMEVPDRKTCAKQPAPCVGTVDVGPCLQSAPQTPCFFQRWQKGGRRLSLDGNVVAHFPMETVIWENGCKILRKIFLDGIVVKS